jgi:hypothetical protein
MFANSTLLAVLRFRHIVLSAATFRSALRHTLVATDVRKLLWGDLGAILRTFVGAGHVTRPFDRAMHFVAHL